MGIFCGRLISGECTCCYNGGKDCLDRIEIYTGTDYDTQILKEIADIYSRFSIKLIKSKRRYDSLMYIAALSGHHAQYKNDIDSIFYDAAMIVFIQQHRFKMCSYYDRYEAYKLMRRLNLYMDKEMRIDCKKVIKQVKNDRDKATLG